MAYLVVIAIGTYHVPGHWMCGHCLTVPYHEGSVSTKPGFCIRLGWLWYHNPGSGLHVHSTGPRSSVARVSRPNVRLLAAGTRYYIKPQLVAKVVF